jgi:hypothetical protein
MMEFYMKKAAEEEKKRPHRFLKMKCTHLLPFKVSLFNRFCSDKI